jgi:hypothetical protein
MAFLFRIQSVSSKLHEHKTVECHMESAFEMITGGATRSIKLSCYPGDDAADSIKSLMTAANDASGLDVALLALDQLPKRVVVGRLMRPRIKQLTLTQEDGMDADYTPDYVVEVIVDYQGVDFDV